MLAQEESSQLCQDLMDAEPGTLRSQLRAIMGKPSHEDTRAGVGVFLLMSCVVNLDSRLKAMGDRWCPF